jgi:hypothetical protein
MTCGLIFKLAESGMGCLFMALVLGFEIVSLCRKWKPISNMAIPGLFECFLTCMIAERLLRL